VGSAYGWSGMEKKKVTEPDGVIGMVAANNVIDA
jgi:hypothetical protein